jgi:hypothetical protein
VRDGPLLRTLKQAANLALNNKETGKRSSWQSTAEKLMAAAETNSKDDIEAATKQIELALLMENRLEMKTGRRSRSKASRAAVG